jgi:hypothetical protein
MPANRIYTSIIFCIAAMAANAGTAPSSGLLSDQPDFAADVSLAETRVLAATQQPIASSAFAAPLTHAAWRDRPSWYVVSDRDRAVSPETEEWMAKRIGATIIHVRTSHLSLISQPSAIVQVIEEAARRHDRVTR